MWFTIHGREVTLHILAKPNAKKTQLVEINDQGLHIMLQAKPQQGVANQVLIAYLARLFELPKSKVKLHKGERSRYKQVVIPLTNRVQQLLDDPRQFLK